MLRVNRLLDARAICELIRKDVIKLGEGISASTRKTKMHAYINIGSFKYFLFRQSTDRVGFAVMNVRYGSDVNTSLKEF